MGLNVRKFVVGFAALSVLVGVFLLYRHFSHTPPIIMEPGRSVSRAVGGSESDTPRQVGKMFDVGVGPVWDTEFEHRDDAGRIDRRFGFEELLYEQGDQWMTKKPYMDLLLPEASCQVTADRGRVRVDTMLRQPTLTDAVFTGNVVLHITPRDPNNPWECFIHLDDVGFLAEKSLFSSEGAVRFLSRSVRLTGTGMELIYDMPRSRLEQFRVFDLDSLRFRSSDVEALADSRRSSSRSRVGEDTIDTQDPNAIPSVVEVAAQPPPPAEPNAPSADVYRCVFRRNVRLDSPDGVALARDRLSINNIRWSGPSSSASSARRPADPNEEESVAAPVRKALDTTASPHLALNSMPEELFDAVVTCDGGADITLINGPRGLVETVAADGPESATADATAQNDAPSEGQYLWARRIDFDFSTNDTTLLGPVSMRFLVDPNALGGRGGDTPMPAVVTAQEVVRIMAAAKRIVLDGGATATLHRSDPNATDEYRLAAPRLTLDLAVEPNAADDIKIDVRRLVADGGADPSDANGPAETPVVTVKMRRYVAGQEMGWATLDARELQYDADPNCFTALGPGAIWLFNAATIQSKTDPNSVLKPCYAHLTDFDTLKYWSLSNRIVAEDDAQQLQALYFPIVDGGYGPETEIVAGHIEATLAEAPEGRMDLASLVASQGIGYNSKAEHLQFSGSEMVYDRDKPRITVRGDDVRPCSLNGVLVDGIVLDPKTGDIEATPRTSIFQVRQ